eukprot:TRINITY_DN11064_c0_g1_i11.p1 TRINITY_DN11064_c0_g1~~TRINITY_DN11064_c0_g1_i11.p1  ORF type:complete len:196 (+),score=42.58 TRINITY_DN11064_c0_g1_i11:363-950(+)
MHAAGCERLLQAKDQLNHLDGLVGDGDCGSTMAACAQATLELLHGHQLPSQSAKLCLALASQVGDIMGGSSGAIYSILLTTLGSRLNDEKMPTPRQLGKALSASLAVVTEYGGAREGDCTMLDVWYPVARELLARDVTWARVAETAARAAANTAQLRPMAGRASYVNQAHSNNVMDPGAVAASEFIQAAVESLAS